MTPQTRITSALALALALVLAAPTALAAGGRRQRMSRVRRGETVRFGRGQVVRSLRLGLALDKVVKVQHLIKGTHRLSPVRKIRVRNNALSRQQRRTLGQQLNKLVSAMPKSDFQRLGQILQGNSKTTVGGSELGTVAVVSEHGAVAVDLNSGAISFPKPAADGHYYVHGSVISNPAGGNGNTVIGGNIRSVVTNGDFVGRTVVTNGDFVGGSRTVNRDGTTRTVVGNRGVVVNGNVSVGGSIITGDKVGGSIITGDKVVRRR